VGALGKKLGDPMPIVSTRNTLVLPATLLMQSVSHGTTNT